MRKDEEYAYIDIDKEEARILYFGCRDIAKYKAENIDKNAGWNLSEDGYFKTFLKGLSAELAVKKKLGVDNAISTIDFSYDNYSKYAHPDLYDIGLKCGVKVGSYDSVLISDYNEDYQIICRIFNDDCVFTNVKFSNDEIVKVPVWVKNVCICGIGSPEILEIGSSKDAVVTKDKSIVRANKSAFTEYDLLAKPNSFGIDGINEFDIDIDFLKRGVVCEES